MADREALRAARQGTKAFRHWLQSSSIEIVDLSNADLRGVDLRWTNFAGANLENARFDGAALTGAYFGPARFKRTAPFVRRADSPVCLNGASFLNTVCLAATFNYAEMDQTSFEGSYLGLANFRHMAFVQCSLKEAQLLNTSFLGCDLSGVSHLDEVAHLGPSHLDILTIQLSKGLSTRFLRQTGMQQSVAESLSSLFKDKGPDNGYSCFLSHSTADKSFCDHLYSRLIDEGLRVWYAPEDMRAGEQIAEQLIQAVRVHDKLLVVLSEASLSSNWVSNELRWALRREQDSKQQVLFPISLISFDQLKRWQLIDPDTGVDIASRIRSYFLPDFSDWRTKESFERAFRRLLKDLGRSAPPHAIG